MAEEESIVAQVAKFLDMEIETDPNILHDRLSCYRNMLHPDKHQNSEENKIAEAKSKKANALLQELATYIRSNPSLALATVDGHQHAFDLVQARTEAAQKDQIIEQLENDLKFSKIWLEQSKSKYKELSRRISKEERTEAVKKHGFRKAPTIAATAAVVAGVSWVTLTEAINGSRDSKRCCPWKGYGSIGQ